MPNPNITYRKAELTDGYSMALCATSAWQSTALSNFLWPHRHLYPRDFILASARRYWSLMSAPNTVIYIGLDTSKSPSPVVGIGAFSRETAHPELLSLVQRPKNLKQMVISWYYTIVGKITQWLWPDRHMDRKAFESFAGDDAIYQQFWKDTYPERWHCRSFSVHPDYQKKGIGSTVMRIVMDTAKAEGLPIVLEASTDGEYLYRKLGFRLVKRFDAPVIKEEKDQGGLMVYEPETMDPAYLMK
ncbi:acyl-CoA N-acyltransferase [Ascodesmis nigricans]|uniref:Acyl-CoA N-acyltransferase n=1 Tax=Ascodesmis nigricans TaxID=341454 RepID=A0A4S2N924_9PEZI|nr:acyl-CoA N-acyltransferase [Ascodesmis nigricans]